MPDASSDELDRIVGRQTVAVSWAWRRLARVQIDPHEGLLVATELPAAPGVYRFVAENPEGEILTYVGQANNVRRRIREHLRLYRDGAGTQVPANQVWVTDQLGRRLANGWRVWVDLAEEVLVDLEADVTLDPLLGMRADTSRERVALEGVALSASTRDGPSLNWVRSTDGEWLLNDRDLRTEYF